MLTLITVMAILTAPAAIRRPANEETRISVDLKQVAIVDVVRLLAEVGGFQVVLDPGISCNPTLKVHEVPWPTVLDVALRTCGLAHEEENGIMRVAPAARLMAEHAERRKLAEEQKLNRPLRTTRYRLSYARAEQMAPILKRFLSPRGEVVVDPRTNTLIIIDIE